MDSGSEDGEVIGISGFSFTEAEFGLVASSEDIQHRVAGLVAGDDVSGLGSRYLALVGGQRQHTVMLRNLWDERMFIVNEPPDTLVSILVESDNDAAVSVIDAYGDQVVYADDWLSGVESGSGFTDVEAPHFVVVSQYTEAPGMFPVSSDRSIERWSRLSEQRCPV